LFFCFVLFCFVFPKEDGMGLLRSSHNLVSLKSHFCGDHSTIWMNLMGLLLNLGEF